MAFSGENISSVGMPYAEGMLGLAVGVLEATIPIRESSLTYENEFATDKD